MLPQCPVHSKLPLVPVPVVCSISSSYVSALQDSRQSMKVYDDQYHKLEGNDRTLRQEDNRIRQEKVR